VGQGIGPEFKPQYPKQNKTKIKKLAKLKSFC
jgi:hypothetical protein